MSAARKYRDKRAPQPIATKNCCLPRTTHSTTMMSKPLFITIGVHNAKRMALLEASVSRLAPAWVCPRSRVV